MGSLQPGQWLREHELAAALEISRTPVREAVRRLAQEGLLEVAENRGVRVRKLTLEEAVDTYEVRALLEGMAARRVAQRADARNIDILNALLHTMAALPANDFAAHIKADDAFHERIAELSGNHALLDVFRLLNGRVTRIKILTRDTNASVTTKRQHLEIVDAIATGNPARAEAAMRSHVEVYRRVVEERLQQVMVETNA